MLIEDGNLERWLNRAASEIKFRPDREMVRAELRGHIEDKIADLQRIFPDIPESEARDRALMGMGDVDELSCSLAKVHKPWLGRLWYACRGLLILSVLVWVFMAGLPALMDRDDDWPIQRCEHWYAGIQPGEWSPPEPARVGDFTLEVTRAARHEESFRDDGGGGKIMLECESAAMTLRMTAPWPWERPPEINSGLESQLRAVDSAGREFSFVRNPDVDEFRGTQPLQGTKTGFCWRQYELYCRDITPGAEWIELRYDFGGRSFTVRVDIPAEVHYYYGGIWDGEKGGAQ